MSARRAETQDAIIINAKLGEPHALKKEIKTNIGQR